MIPEKRDLLRVSHMITMMDIDFKNVAVFNCCIEIKSLEGGDDRPPPVI